MSYGIWRKRGQGWCSIEIDTPFFLTHNSTLVDSNQLRWELNQVKNQPQRTIVEYCPGGGEHVRWIAYDDAAALDRALDAVEASDYDREQCGVIKSNRDFPQQLHIRR